MTSERLDAPAWESYPADSAALFHLKSAQSRMGEPWRVGHLQSRIENGAGGCELLAETWLAARARHHSSLKALQKIIARRPELFAAPALTPELTRAAFIRFEADFEAASQLWTPPQEQEKRLWSKKVTDQNLQDTSRALFERAAKWARAGAAAGSFDALATQALLEAKTNERQRQALDFLRLLRSLGDPLASLGRPETQTLLGERLCGAQGAPLKKAVALLPEPERFSERQGALFAQKMLEESKRFSPKAPEAIDSLLGSFLYFAENNTPEAASGWLGFSSTLAHSRADWRDWLLLLARSSPAFLALFLTLARQSGPEPLAERFNPQTWSAVWEAHARSSGGKTKIERHLFLAIHAPENTQARDFALETFTPRQRSHIESALLAQELPLDAAPNRRLGSRL